MNQIIHVIICKELTFERRDKMENKEKQEKAIKTLESDKGTIKIADEVVRVIAGLAADEVEGISMSGGIVGGIAEKLGRKSLSKGVKVQVGEKEAVVDLYVIADYGVNISDVATKIQDNVRKSIENMTGLSVPEVNVHVQGVNVSGDEGREG